MESTSNFTDPWLGPQRVPPRVPASDESSTSRGSSPATGAPVPNTQNQEPSDSDEGTFDDLSSAAASNRPPSPATTRFDQTLIRRERDRARRAVRQAYRASGQNPYYSPFYMVGDPVQPPSFFSHAPAGEYCTMNKDAIYTYVHMQHPGDADLFEDFCKDKLPADDIYVPPHLQPINPEDEDDVVPDQHAAFGIQKATQKIKEPAWKDLGLAELMHRGPGGGGSLSGTGGAGAGRGGGGAGGRRRRGGGGGGFKGLPR